MSHGNPPLPEEPQPDVLLQRALVHAPDHDSAPPIATRQAVLHAAAQALKATPVSAPHKWWQAIGMLWQRPSYAAGLATVVVGSLVLGLWMGREPPPLARFDDAEVPPPPELAGRAAPEDIASAPQVALAEKVTPERARRTVAKAASRDNAAPKSTALGTLSAGKREAPELLQTPYAAKQDTAAPRKKSEALSARVDTARPSAPTVVDEIRSTALSTAARPSGLASTETRMKRNAETKRRPPKASPAIAAAPDLGSGAWQWLRNGTASPFSASAQAWWNELASATHGQWQPARNEHRKLSATSMASTQEAEQTSNQATELFLLRADGARVRLSLSPGRVRVDAPEGAWQAPLPATFPSAPTP